MKWLRIISIVILTLFGVLNFALSFAVFGKNIPIALLFVGACMGILAGLYLKNRYWLGIGLVLSLVTPILVGVMGVEPFEIQHHIVRVTILIIVLIPLFTSKWPSPLK